MGMNLMARPVEGSNRIGTFEALARNQLADFTGVVAGGGPNRLAPQSNTGIAAYIESETMRSGPNRFLKPVTKASFSG